MPHDGASPPHSKPSKSSKAKAPRSAIDPFAPSKCDILTDRDWVSFGLAPGQKMFRHNGGPPVFGTREAYDIAKGRGSSPNPHGLEFIFVRLRGDLDQADYDAHYADMYRRSEELRKKGIEGTGIVHDSCSEGPTPQEKWMFYFAVYDAGTLAEIRKDDMVISCGVSGKEKIRTASVVDVPHWGVAAMTKEKWNLGMYNAGERSSHKIRVPPHFHREQLGAGNTIFSIDHNVDPTLPELLDAQGNTRVQKGLDICPLTTPGHILSAGERHGDCMMTLASGRICGIAPSATIVAVNIFKEGEDGAEPEHVFVAVNWIIAEVGRRRIRNRAVLNMSLTGVPDAYDYAGYLRDLIDLQDMDRVGLIIVHSAGNQNREITLADPLHPQMCEDVVVVAGMACDGYLWSNEVVDPESDSDSDSGSDKSDEGPLMIGSNYGDVVDIVAPCQHLEIPLHAGQVDRSTGCSNACALVSGFITCLLDGRRTRQQVLELLYRKHTRAGTNGIRYPILCVD
ncbi:subtilisin-like protein [Ascobolus immersus RN42]|uniref:Subtilisin-like protein n=1 Tax=Ascobolus immersus RN42 TaxID=1160509 RepID=A0A3N4IA84_ASCIM|nr:subtilisin-like protein [Ascobolus immersus RN42]